MGGLYRDEHGVLRMKVWWGDLEAADPDLQPRAPTLILPNFVEERPFPDLAALAAELAALLEGRAAIVSRTVATLERDDGIATFPAFTVQARARDAAGHVPAALYLATVAVQKTTQAELEAAIAEAQQARGREVAA